MAGQALAVVFGAKTLGAKAKLKIFNKKQSRFAILLCGQLTATSFSRRVWKLMRRKYGEGCSGLSFRKHEGILGTGRLLVLDYLQSLDDRWILLGLRRRISMRRRARTCLWVPSNDAQPCGMCFSASVLLADVWSRSRSQHVSAASIFRTSSSVCRRISGDVHFRISSVKMFRFHIGDASIYEYR